MALFGRTSNFDRFLDKSTSHMLLEPDWTAILQICDCIRQGDVQPKYAFNAIKKKLYAQNPHVALYSLQVLESCVKNCGTAMHTEVTTRQFMEELRELVKATPHETVKTKILELIQAWAHAFRNEPNFRAVQDTVNLMKMEGFKFPAMKESDAMFSADQAPDWADGDCCHRCRVQFSVVQRKHHCRNCGQIFCNRCSNRTSPIPRFGIEREVRVCEACWEKLNKPSSQKGSAPGSEQSSPHLSQSNSSSTKTSTTGTGKSEQELQEEEDLQLALALSKSEAENKEKARSSGLSTSTKMSGSTYSTSALNESPTSDPIKKEGLGGLDSELAHYLNREYWDQKHQQHDSTPQNRVSPVPSAPATVQNNYSPTKVSEKFQNGETEEMEGFLTNLGTTLEIFVNRMKSNYSRGRPIANDTYVQSLFMNVTSMHSQLLKYVQEQDDLRVHFERLQDKLNQARDARAALDSLRDEHRDRLRREAEEAERLRQIQMAQKLEIMRKKKQEYLQYQRQMAMQRIQEQEREMQLRQEQQKQQYLMGNYPPQGPYISPGQMYHSPMPQQPPPGPIVAGSPHHMPYQGPPVSFPQGDYQGYNMQAMAQALPPASQAGQFAPPVSVAPPPQTMASHGGMQQTTTPTSPGPGPQGPHVEMQMPPPQQQISEQSLISFD